MPKFNSLGDRMKFYEWNFGMNLTYLMPYVPAIIRLDGRAFHTFTKGLDRPFDQGMCDLMDETTKSLVEETGACMGYTQSDEITLVLLSEDHTSQVYFDGRVNKINSILAGKCTHVFTNGLEKYIPKKIGHFPQFDCRCFSVPNKGEAVNAILWREQDATRNSIQMLGQSCFSQKALQGKNCDEIQEMLWQKHSINWGNDFSSRIKRGGYFQKRSIEKPCSIEEIDKLPKKHAARNDPNFKVFRRQVVSLDMPVLTKVVNQEAVFFEEEAPQIATSELNGDK